MSKSKFFLYASCAVFALCTLARPAEVATATLSGLGLFALSVLPALLPFFFLSSVLSLTCRDTDFGIGRVTRRLYGTSDGFITTMSLIAGYPMSAKLIGELYADGAISREEALAVTAHTSLPGPMFVIGTVGVSVLGSASLGVWLWCVQLLACATNGLLYRIKDDKRAISLHVATTSPNVLQGATQSAIFSALTVGLYMGLASGIIKCFDVLFTLPPLSKFCEALCLDKSLTSTAISCIVEITCGVRALFESGSFMVLPLISLTMALGGASVMAQSVSLANGALSARDYVKVKSTQAAIAFVLTLPLLALT